MILNSLFQVNTIPNCNNRYLDLILCSNDLVSKVQRHHSPLVEEDGHHPTLLVSVSIPSCEPKTKFPANNRKFYYDFKNGDLPTLYCALSEKSWRDVFGSKDVKKACDHFYQELNWTMNSYIPQKSFKTSVFPKWYSPELVKIIKSKNHYRKLFKNSKLIYYSDMIMTCRKEIKSEETTTSSLMMQKTTLRTTLRSYGLSSI